MQVNGGPSKFRSPSDVRIDTWLWLFLRDENRTYPIGDFNYFYFRENIARHLGSSKISELVEVVSNQYLLPQEILKWITKDERQVKWILNYLQIKLGCTIYSCPAGLFGRDRVIATLDLWKNQLDLKGFEVDAMRLAWNENIKDDNIFQWFAEAEEVARCAAAWEWLAEKGRTSFYGVARITSHKELLMFFDVHGISSAQKQLDVKAIKKRWDGRRSKEKEIEKGKGQCNVTISKQAIANLNQLAAKHGLRKPEIIEMLIQGEFEKGSYLLEKK